MSSDYDVIVLGAGQPSAPPTTSGAGGGVPGY
jgi:hypothetical protein